MKPEILSIKTWEKCYYVKKKYTSPSVFMLQEVQLIYLGEKPSTLNQVGKEINNMMKKKDTHTKDNKRVAHPKNDKEVSIQDLKLQELTSSELYRKKHSCMY